MVRAQPARGRREFVSGGGCVRADERTSRWATTAASGKYDEETATVITPSSAWRRAVDAWPTVDPGAADGVLSGKRRSRGPKPGGRTGGGPDGRAAAIPAKGGRKVRAPDASGGNAPGEIPGIEPQRAAPAARPRARVKGGRAPRSRDGTHAAQLEQDRIGGPCAALARQGRRRPERSGRSREPSGNGRPEEWRRVPQVAAQNRAYRRLARSPPAAGR